MNRLVVGVGLVAWFGCSPLVKPSAPPTRLEVQSAILVPGVGTSTKLAVRAFDAQGNAVAAPTLTFTSSTAHVTAASDGTLTGVSDGTSRVTVTGAGLTARSSVLVATPVAGAVLVDDENVDGDLRPLEPLAPLDVGYRYEVTLKDMEAPAASALVVGTGALPIGGRVVATSGQVITLELVPLPDLFPTLRLDEQLSLNDAELELDAEVLETFDVEQTPAGGLHLALKAGQTLTGSARKHARAPNGTLEFDVGPVACRVEASVFQLSLAKMDIALDPGLTVQRVFDPEHQRVVVTSNAKASVSVKPVLQSQLEGKLTCELEIGKRYIPLPGAVGLALGFDVPFGVGFELETKTPLVSGVSLDFTRELSATANAGVDCTTSCTLVGDFSNTSAPFTGIAPPTVKLELPTSLKVEASAYAYAFAKLDFGGSQIVRSLGGAVGVRNTNIELLVLKAGLKFEGKFASEEAQAGDAAFSGGYRLLFEAGLEPGRSVETFFRFIKITVVKLELKYTKELATSPQGTLSLDKQTFARGDDLTFTVAFTPDSLEFPAIGFNAKSVRVYRKVPGLVLVGQSPITPGQTSVTLNAVATEDGTASEFVGFVETAFLDALSCELAVPYAGPRVQLALTPFPGPRFTLLLETQVTGYDCAVDNSIRTEARFSPMADLPLPTTLTAGGTTMRSEEIMPGVFAFTIDAPQLGGTLSGTCPNGDTYSESSVINWSVALHVTPMDPGSFNAELSPPSMQQGRWEFASRADWDNNVVTPVTVQPAPMRNDFPAGKTFGLSFDGTVDRAQVMTNPRVLTLTFTP